LALGKGLGLGLVSVWGWVLRTASASISRNSVLVFVVVGFHGGINSREAAAGIGSHHRWASFQNWVDKTNGVINTKTDAQIFYQGEQVYRAISCRWSAASDNEGLQSR
jgi:hypothetical protein